MLARGKGKKPVNRWLEMASRAFDTRTAAFAEARFADRSRPCVSEHSIAAPLTATGGEIARILGGMFIASVRETLTQIDEILNRRHIMMLHRRSGGGPARGTSMTTIDAGTPEKSGRSPEKPMLLDAPEHPAIAELRAYWEAKRGSRAIADRADINPAEIVRLLPYLIVLDVLDGGTDFRVRVFGTALVELMREERTGKRVSEFGKPPKIPTDPVELQNRWLTISRLVLQGRRPLIFKAPTVSPERNYMFYHGMFAPLTAGGEEIGQIIGILITEGSH